MEKDTLEITKEDRDLLVLGLRSIRLTGTIEQLPSGMEKIMYLIAALQSKFMEEGNDGASGTADGGRGTENSSS